MLSLKDSTDINLAAHITRVNGSIKIETINIFAESNKAKCFKEYNKRLRTE